MRDSCGPGGVIGWLAADGTKLYRVRFFSFFGMCFVVVVPLFLSISFSFCFVFMLSLELYFVHVPLIFSYPADHVPGWQPCIYYWVWLMPERFI